MGGTRGKPWTPYGRRALLCLPLVIASFLPGCGGDASSLELSRRGDQAMVSGDLRRAHRLFVRAVEQDPAFAKGWLNRGLAELRLDKPQQASASFRQALALYRADAKEDPFRLENLEKRAFLLVALGRKADARELVSEATEKRPDHDRLARLQRELDARVRKWQRMLDRE